MTTDEAYVERAIDLARESAANGNNPFGSLLVVDGEVVAEERNTVVTDDDVTGHPELKLARWAARELDPGERADCTMYTSTEPCAMCSAAIYYAGLRRVVYSVSAEALDEIKDSTLVVPSTTIFERGAEPVEVIGPVLPEEGERVHREFW
jgi:tRNA(Arg) A34 adenosine deaminase TadA